MAGGAPVPIPVSQGKADMILSIKDLERAASKKLGKTAGGKGSRFSCFFGFDKLCLLFWGSVCVVISRQQYKSNSRNMHTISVPV